MTWNDEQKRAREERSQQVLALVEELGSLTAAAAHLGISKERVSKLIGRGAYPRSIAVTCQDCGRLVRVLRSSEPRCERCRRYLATTGRQWTPDVATRKPPRPSRAQQIRDRMRPDPPRLELIPPVEESED